MSTKLKSIKTSIEAIKSAQKRIEKKILQNIAFEDDTILYIRKEIFEITQWAYRLIKHLSPLESTPPQKLRRTHKSLTRNLKKYRESTSMTPVIKSSTHSGSDDLKKLRKIAELSTLKNLKIRTLEKEINQIQAKRGELEANLRSGRDQLKSLFYERPNVSTVEDIEYPGLVMDKPVIETSITINYSFDLSALQTLTPGVWPKAPTLNSPSKIASKVLSSLSKILYHCPEFEKPLPLMSLPYLHGPFFTANGKDTVVSQYANNRRNGVGLYIWSDGRVYEGGWKDGKCHGYGRMIFKNGNWYQGEMKEDKKDGFGTFKWMDGDWFQGEYRNDKICGFGIYRWKQGDMYEGEWKDGVFHGKGKKVWASGKVQEGSWIRGKFVGGVA